MGSTIPEHGAIQWILDTRPLWPQARYSRDLETHAASAIALLRPEDRDKVYRNYHVRDAKLVLASHLLKHFLVARTCPDLSWWDIHLTRDAHHKPIFVHPSTGHQPVSFNVSHQAGLVVLVAVVTDYSGGGTYQEVDVGVDVVCTSERRTRDIKTVLEEKKGWSGFVDVYSDVFARSETNFLKYSLHTLPGMPRTGNFEEVIDFKLRCFYTLWCLREAYVKMTAEALMAEWLDVLEFRKFVPPDPTPDVSIPAIEGTNEVVKVREIVFRGKKVDYAQVEIRGVGADYMIATAVRTRPDKEGGLRLGLGAFEMMDLDEIVRLAQRGL